MKKTKKTIMPVSVRLDEEVHKRILQIAEAEERSVSYMLNLAARQFVEAHPVGKSAKK